MSRSNLVHSQPSSESLPLVVSRRRLLQAGLALTATGTFSNSCSLAFAADDAVRADQLVAGKDRRLVVHTAAKTGFEIESTLEILAEDKITPAEKLFVRNNQQPDWAATLEPAPDKPWSLEIAGFTEFQRTATLAELKAMPQEEHEIVLQCSGNGRAMLSAIAPVKGAQWSYGAMGNVRFKGVTVKSLFEKFDVRPHESARFVTAEGADVPGKPGAADFEHSLPLADVLERSIVALEMNGKPIPAVHGGPLRLITPGYYGTMNVKWLTRLRLEAQETVNHHQVKRYRMPRELLKPGTKFESTLSNSDAHWRMKIKSVIFTPARDAKLASDRFLASGVAWNDGASLIDAVEISTDGGKSWRRAELERGGRYAWQRWQLPLALPRGKQTIISRAVDALGNTQPLDGAINWNPDGYLWHAADRVTVEVA